MPPLSFSIDAGRIDGKESAIQVGVDDVLENGLVSRASRRFSGDSGVGEDDVKIAEIPGECCEKLLAIFGGYGEIGTVAARVRAQFGYCFIQRFLSCCLIATSAPSAMKRRAVAKPMPLLPPVMRAFFWL